MLLVSTREIMYKPTMKWRMLKKLLLSIISFILISPVLADDHIYTNKDLEQYKEKDNVVVEKQQPPAQSKSKNKSKSNKSDKPLKKPVTAFIKKDEIKPKRYEVAYISREGSSNRIIVPVTFNNSVKALMLLDTGAPGMYISRYLAEKLGAFDKGEGMLQVEAKGIGGRVPAKLTVIDNIQIGGAGEQFVPTTIGDSLSGMFEGLVGMNFLSRYSVQIDSKRHVVIFEELPEEPDLLGGHDEEWWRTNYRQFSMSRKDWEEFKTHVHGLKDPDNKLKRLRDFADKQVIEADKLMRKLDNYAIDYAVPMSWREY